LKRSVEVSIKPPAIAASGVSTHINATKTANSLCPKFVISYLRGLKAPMCQRRTEHKTRQGACKSFSGSASATIELTGTLSCQLLHVPVEDFPAGPCRVAVPLGA
jgi:hypothetical protein